MGVIGENAKDEYVAEVDDIRDDQVSDGERRLNAVTDTSPATDDVANFGAAEQSFREAASDLDNLDPPDDLEDEHDKLKDAVEQLAEASASGTSAATTGYTLVSLDQVQSDIRAARDDVEERFEEIDDTG